MISTTLRTSLWILVALVLVVRLVWWPARPRLYREVPLPGLRRFVTGLLAQMASGGFFIADRRDGPGFLPLALREVRGEIYVVEFGLPESNWSASEFESARAAFAIAGFEPTVETGVGPVSRFLRVEMEGSQPAVTERVMALLELAVRQLNWREESTFDVRFGGPLDLARIRAQVAATRRRSA